MKTLHCLEHQGTTHTTLADGTRRSWPSSDPLPADLEQMLHDAPADIHEQLKHWPDPVPGYERQGVPRLSDLLADAALAIDCLRTDLNAAYDDAREAAERSEL